MTMELAKQLVEGEKYLARYYGWEAQSRQCIEEMSELTKAINKLWRYQKGYLPNIATEEELKKHIVEEMVDVSICVDELAWLLESEGIDIRSLISETYVKKINRELKRIEERLMNGNDKS